MKTIPRCLVTTLLALAALTSVGCPGGPSVETPHPIGTVRQDGRWALQLAGRPLWVRTANTTESRQRGLQDVTSLADDEGMLFIYDDLAIRRYWMKDCRLDLDIVWADENGRILGVTEIVAPKVGATDTEIPRAASPEPAAFVLEVSRGWCRRFGAGPGTQIQGVPPHPLRRTP